MRHEDERLPHGGGRGEAACREFLLGWVCAWAVFATLFMCYMAVQAPRMVKTHQAEIIEDRRSVIEFSSIAPSRARIMAHRLNIPDYWYVKGFDVVFFAQSDTTEPEKAQRWRDVEFSITCRYSAMTYKTFVLIPLGRFDPRAGGGVACTKRMRVPTSQMVQPQMCSLVVTPGESAYVPDARDMRTLTIDWSLIIKPAWHWTDWFPRQMTDEYYRALSMTGLQVAPVFGSNASGWYGLEGAHGSPPPAYDHDWCRQLKQSREADKIALAVYEAARDKEAAAEAAEEQKKK